MIPIYPQVRPLLERLHAKGKHKAWMPARVS